MARRWRNRSTSSDWSRYAAVWPYVIAPPVPVYVSVFTPKGVSRPNGVQPADLGHILAGCDRPALYEAHQQTYSLPPAPILSGQFPPAPKPPGERPRSSAEPKWEQFQPKDAKEGILGALRAVLNGTSGEARRRFDAEHRAWKTDRYKRVRDEEAFARAEREFERDVKEHARKREGIERELEKSTAEFNDCLRRVEAERAADLAAFEAMLSSAANGDKTAVERLSVQACLAIPMPLAFPETPRAHFDPTDGILLLDVNVPNVAEAGLHVQLKTKRRDASEKEVRAAQEFVVHALALRILHEIFTTPEFACVQMVGVNMALAYTDRRYGKRMNEIIASLAATRDEFASIDIAHVDPKLCFRSLKGVATPSFQEPAPVRPLLSFGSTDGRIVESREIVDHLEQETNLAALDWEDFEHIVRELFAKLFSARATAEVHVTRASRDYGVDALVFDPDPIHGGKFVIQAKRYVNTVDVAAIRDLYGTVFQNEGANRGYIVTTSSFGPEAHAFAKGKPLTLTDGAHLLQLLKEHGYTFRIDLQEAREVLHGR